MFNFLLINFDSFLDRLAFCFTFQELHHQIHLKAYFKVLVEHYINFKELFCFAFFECFYLIYFLKLCKESLLKNVLTSLDVSLLTLKNRKVTLRTLT